MAGRYYPQKDIDTFDKFNKELVGDLYSGQDGVINQQVVIAIFSFIRQSLVDISYVVEIGDIIDWNSGYWEVSSISENQLIGGQTDYNHSIVCNTFLNRIAHLNIERVRSI